METEIEKIEKIETEIVKLKQRQKEISKVVDRYMRIKMKRQLRKLFAIRLR